MHGKTITAAALVGIAGYAAARPMPSQSSQVTGTSATTTTVINPTGSGSPYANGTASGGFKYPLPNGFPGPNANVAAIEKQAQGTLPNGTPPPSLHTESETSLGFVAFNELFEVAFFTELINNITTAVPGYTSDDIPNHAEVLDVLKAAVAQEELHELNANGAFNKFTGQTIQPCRYNFPVDNVHDAIALASTFTDVVLATLPDIQTIFAENDDSALIRGVGSIIGQEGEQNGFYRQLLGKLPAALPFLTGGSRDLAFNAILQNFVVPGSCPSLGLLKSRGLPEFDVLKVVTTDFALEDITAEFALETVHPAEASTPGNNFVQQSDNGLFLTYINQQNVPISVPMKISGADKTGALKFKASFPGKTNDLNGLTIAAVTKGDGPFSSPDDVAAATVFGPGLIEI